MSTTTNIVAGATLVSALVVGGIALSPDGGVAPEAGVVDAGPVLVGAFYLRFPDKAAWEQAAKEAGQWRQAMAQEAFCDRWGVEWLDGGTVDGGCVSYGTRLVPTDGGEVAASSGHAIDVVGTIVLPGPDGGTETLDGWHVNFQGVLPDQWRQYLVEPRNPVRTWAR
jgi:hypothetical protein